MKNFLKNYSSILFMLAGIVGGCILGACFPATETSAGGTKTVAPNATNKN